jgi:hypothetical protein
MPPINERLRAPPLLTIALHPTSSWEFARETQKQDATLKGGATMQPQNIDNAS